MEMASSWLSLLRQEAVKAVVRAPPAKRGTPKTGKPAHHCVVLLHLLAVIVELTLIGVVHDAGVIGRRNLSLRGVHKIRLADLRPRHQRGDFVDRLVALGHRFLHRLHADPGDDR